VVLASTVGVIKARISLHGPCVIRGGNLARRMTKPISMFKLFEMFPDEASARVYLESRA